MQYMAGLAARYICTSTVTSHDHEKYAASKLVVYSATGAYGISA